MEELFILNTFEAEINGLAIGLDVEDQEKNLGNSPSF